MRHVDDKVFKVWVANTVVTILPVVVVGNVNEVAVGVVAVKADDRLVFETDVLTIKAVSIVNVVGPVLLTVSQ